ncbi:hypothetical protein SAY87_023302 [Trapa incisa]|uniref:Uncharacterized protein n=1 Tax=Trapa incisa TaxID=236973 RepID=A0AAN7Q5M9_9MYRT|nr:hypothetical protein SAY87_023302 [Trapa incisa]
MFSTVFFLFWNLLFQWLCNADKSSHEPRLRLNSKSRKEYLVLTCGPPSVTTTVPNGKGEDGRLSTDESSGDEENHTVGILDRHRPRKKQKVNKKGKGREWVVKKKEHMRRKAISVVRNNGVQRALPLIRWDPLPIGVNLIRPDSDQIPYVESGSYVAYNNVKGGIYWKAMIAYGALSTCLGEEDFFFNRPSSLDSAFLGHALIVLQTLPETSSLRSKLSQHDNLVRYAEKHKVQYMDTSSISSPQLPSIPKRDTRRKRPLNSGSKPKSGTKKERTPEE